ncbi:hypothetical protein KC343_g2168 [Hortaea werneckii]|nr:hypothetical protein KC323_g8167 [Hortaea werneckii]KAI6856519.1 hypothetical protein KC338_g8394 [Hortaea werneckii]KAI7344539.1 hypothetical protein KC320_g8785 [Hortaea werneckii]KAI7569699.1 hypothetical protein KC317_g3100 [Hortaea werneckii]KAI7623607.1 hypothetical protein KC346_g2657 [Hortaea werneckii]
MAGNPPSTVFPLFISFRGQQTAVPLPIANGGHTPIDMNIIIGNKRRVSFGNTGDIQTNGYSSTTRFTAEVGQGQNSIGNDEAAVGTAKFKIRTFLPAPNPGTIIKPSFVSHDEEIGKLYSHFLKHKSYGGRLDFSKAQAVAMVLYKAKWPLTLDEITAEVLTMSPTYTFEMVSGKPAAVLDSFTDEIRLLDMDVNITPRTNASPLISLSDSAALRFLTTIQPLPMPPGPEHPRQVPKTTFMDLPPEMRLYIYKLVFSFPKSGVRVCHNAKSGLQELHMLTRSFDERKTLSDWYQSAPVRSATSWQSPSNYIRSLPVSTVLSLLCVNKFFYHEAIKVFYNINHFHCWDTRATLGLVRGISPSKGKLPRALEVDRRQFIRRLSFDFRVSQRFYNTQTFNAIAKHCPNLTHLGVLINEDHWDARNNQGVAIYPDPTSYPGILAFYRVLQSRYLKEIYLEGTCNKIKRLLRRPPLALSQLADGKFWPPTSLTLKIKHANGATEVHTGRGNGRFRRIA